LKCILKGSNTEKLAITASSVGWGESSSFTEKGGKKKKERLFSSASSSEGLHENELEEVLTFIISRNQI